MNVVYKKEWNTSYLVLEKTEEISEFAMNMLQENEIQGLLPFEKRSFNGEESFYYDISGKYTLENLVKMRSLKETDIKALLEGLLFTMQICSSYFLDISGLFLDFDLIFEAEGIYSFCYYPGKKKEQETFEKKLNDFGEKLIGYVDHDDEQAVTLVYRFYRLAKENTLTAVQILQQLLEEWEEQKAAGLNSEKELSKIPMDEEIKLERESLYEFSYDDKEKDEIKEDPESPDYLTIIIFLILAVGSITYFVYRFMSAEVFSLGVELSCREGILAAVFLVLSLPGIFLSLYLERDGIPIFRGP